MPVSAPQAAEILDPLELGPIPDLSQDDPIKIWGDFRNQVDLLVGDEKGDFAPNSGVERNVEIGPITISLARISVGAWEFHDTSGGPEHRLRLTVPWIPDAPSTSPAEVVQFSAVKTSSYGKPNRGISVSRGVVAPHMPLSEALGIEGPVFDPRSARKDEGPLLDTEAMLKRSVIGTPSRMPVATSKDQHWITWHWDVFTGRDNSPLLKQNFAVAQAVLQRVALENA